MKIGSLCTGYGGLDMAARNVFGGELEWWSDIDPGPIAVMSCHSPDIPNIGDIKTVDWQSIPHVDILTAGYPCQPFSNAGKRLGTEDPRHIWPFIAEGIGVLRPRIVLLENVAGHLRRGFDVVSADLADLGYHTAWSVVRASDVGAPHQRARLYVVAQDAHRSASGERWQSAPGQAEGGRPRADVGGRGGMAAAHAEGNGRNEWRAEHAGLEGTAHVARNRRGRVERWGDYADAITRWEQIVRRVAPEPTVLGARGAKVLSPYLVEWMMGLPEGHVTGVEGLTRNQQLKLLGNGVVYQQAEYAIRGLMDAL